MINDILVTLEWIRLHSTKNDKKIATFLLDNFRSETKTPFKTVDDLSKIVNLSYSGIDRFIKTGKWLSYKHFYHSYMEAMNLGTKKNRQSNSSETNAKWMQISENVAVELKNNFFLICSKKSRPIGYWTEYRLSEIGKPSYVFDGEAEQIPSFINKMKPNDVLFLITVSGNSRIVNKALESIARLPRVRMPKIYILSTAHWLDIFDKYDFITSIRVDANYVSESWESYNFLMIELLNEITKVINTYFLTEWKK